MQLVYSALLYLLWPVLLVLTIVQSRQRKGGFRYIAERMGWRSSATGESQRDVWFHAASVGEARSLFPLLQSLCSNTRAGSQSHRVFVSVNTPEALRALQEFVEKLGLSSQVEIGYCPIDFYFATRRFISKVRARQLCVVETEIWLNLFILAKSAGLRLSIINARLSSRTRSVEGLAARFYRLALIQIDDLAARSRDDADAYYDLGVDREKIIVLGNLKRCVVTEQAPDIVRVPDIHSYGLMISSRPGEELLVWDAWSVSFKDTLLVIAPRHMQRVNGVKADLERRGARVTLYSQATPAQLKSLAADADVLLVDRMGCIDELLTGSLLALVGGTFADFGGHNVLQPALAGRYVLTGPYIANIEDDVEWLKEYESIHVVANLEGLEADLEMIARSPRKASAEIVEHSRLMLCAYKDFIISADQ